MSEYQRLAFRAIDGPVSEANLEYMRKQSSRAEITPWSFDNEYHYGDFHGNVEEMLRRGYAIHLHYANFGVRKIMIRLPEGLANAGVAEPYFEEDSLQFLKDKKGPGGILCIDPCYEPGELEELWDLDELADRLAPLRDEILEGDLRPLYLAHLAVARDNNHDPEETREAPVPAGLVQLTNAQRALAEFYGLSESLIAAAARQSPTAAKKSEGGERYQAWLEGRPEATKNEWLAQLMADPRSTIRKQILAEFQKTQEAPSWPTFPLNRTIAQLEETAKSIQQESNRKAADKAAKKRAETLAGMAADPTPTLRQTERLVAQRGADAYCQLATLLADLREALTGTSQAGLAEQQARKLKNENPTLHKLTSELRRRGFIPK